LVLFFADKLYPFLFYSHRSIQESIKVMYNKPVYSQRND